VPPATLLPGIPFLSGRRWNFDRPLSALLIGINIANILAASMATVFCRAFWEYRRKYRSFGESSLLTKYNFISIMVLCG
jgi:hypothetical protein